MYPNHNKKPLCKRDRDELAEGDFRDVVEPDNTGGKVRVTRYSDGSSTTHFGGMTGDIRTDKFGNEC